MTQIKIDKSKEIEFHEKLKNMQCILIMIIKRTA